MLGLALLCYLGCGCFVAYGNDRLVLRDHTGGFERYNYMLRTVLAWPSYILEDFAHLMALEDDDDADG